MGFSSDIRRLRTALLVVATFALTYIYHHNFFYRYGGYLMDAGENAFLFFRSGMIPQWSSAMELQVPALAHHSHSFFQYHISPTISLFSLASYAFPFDRLEWFSFCMAASYSTIMWAMCSAVDSLGGDRRDWTWTIAGGAAGIALALSGFIFSCLVYPHLEILFVAFGLCFLVLLLRRKIRGAAIFFTLACCMREDAGFHLTAILFAFWIASLFRPQLVAFRRYFLIFTILAFASSIALLIIQKTIFPLPSGTGSPLQVAFFAGNNIPVTGSLITTRLAALWHHGMLLALPVALTFAWAAATKNWLLPLGWLVYLPWFMLNFLSNDPSRQIISLYHGFPFFFSLAWLVLVTPKFDFPAAKPGGFLTLTAIASISISSALALKIQDPDVFKGMLTRMTSLPLRKAKPFQDLDHSLLGHADFFGRIGLDSAAACMFVEWASPTVVDYNKHHYDTLVFFKNTMFREDMNRIALRDRIFHFYSMAGTDAIVATRHELPDDFDGRHLFQPCEFLLSLASFDLQKAMRGKDGSVAQTQTDGCIVVFGPNVALAPGKYRVNVALDAVDGEDRKLAGTLFRDQPVALLEVTSHAGNVQLAKSEVTGASLPASTSVEFEVSKEECDSLFEFRVASRGRGRIMVKSITLSSLDVSNQ